MADLPRIRLGARWPKWKRLATSLGVCILGALVAAVALIAYILIGSDERPPGWLAVIFLAGVLASLGGLLSAIRILLSGR